MAQPKESGNIPGDAVATGGMRSEWHFTVPPAPTPRSIMKRYGLTRRQAQIAVLLYWRRTDKEIARQLRISAKTAAAHVAVVLDRLNAETRRDVEACLTPHSDLERSQ